MDDLTGQCFVLNSNYSIAALVDFHYRIKYPIFGEVCPKWYLSYGKSEIRQLPHHVIDLFSGTGGLTEGFASEGFDIIAHIEKDPWPVRPCVRVFVITG